MNTYCQQPRPRKSASSHIPNIRFNEPEPKPQGDWEILSDEILNNREARMQKASRELDALFAECLQAPSVDDLFRELLPAKE